MTYSLICNRSLAVIIHANLKRHLKLNNLSLSFLKLFNIAQIFNNHLSTFHSAQYKQIGKLFHTWHTKTSLFKSLLTIAHYSLRLAYENGQLLTQTYKFRSQNLLTSVFSFEQFWRKFNHGINKFEKKIHIWKTNIVWIHFMGSKFNREKHWSLLIGMFLFLVITCTLVKYLPTIVNTHNALHD